MSSLKNVALSIHIPCTNNNFAKTIRNFFSVSKDNFDFGSQDKVS